MKLIKQFFSRDKKMPNLYAIDRMTLSMNELQSDRYMEREFLYYNTLYRDSIREKIECLLTEPKNRKIHLVGLMGSGKSYFLSDYVLRNRFQGPEHKFRILYINNSQEFLSDHINYLFNEIKYMVCLDFENNKFDFEGWLEKLYQSRFPRKHSIYFEFLEELKIYYKSRGISLILIWDQINVMYRMKKQNKLGFQIYSELTGNESYFDHMVLSASNNNQEINIEASKIITIEMNPFDIFNKKELVNLIEAETEFFKLIPLDVNKENIFEYVSALSESLNFSVTEYYFYKFTAWDSKLHCSIISKNSAETNENNYFTARSIAIQKSERKFREEYLKDDNDVNFYNSIIKKIQIFNQNIYIFDGNTVKYNSLFFFK